MLSHDDSTRHIKESRSARMEQRMKPQVKKTIQRAAALLGVDETAFVTNSAYERARAAIEDHERTLVAGEDRAVFFAALEKPAEPTPALLEAVAAHRRLIRDGE